VRRHARARASVPVAAGVGESDEAGGGRSGAHARLDQLETDSHEECVASRAWRRTVRRGSAYVRVKIDRVRCVGCWCCQAAFKGQVIMLCRVESSKAMK
jgi:hypothetical protein